MLSVARTKSSLRKRWLSVQSGTGWAQTGAESKVGGVSGVRLPSAQLVRLSRLLSAASNSTFTLPHPLRENTLSQEKTLVALTFHFCIHNRIIISVVGPSAKFGTFCMHMWCFIFVPIALNTRHIFTRRIKCTIQFDLVNQS